MVRLVDPTLQFRSTDSFLKGINQGWDLTNDARKNHLEAVQRNLMKEVGASAAEGDYLGAARTAFEGGDLKTGTSLGNYKANLDNMSMNKMLKVQRFFHDAAQRADTPEKWSSVVKMGRSIFGDEANEYSDFSMREAAVDDMAQSIRELDMELKRARLAQIKRSANPTSSYDQRAAAVEKYGDDPNADFILGAKSTNKAPTTKKFVDQEGNERMHLYEPRTDSWVPIGGVEAASKDLTPAQKEVDKQFGKDYTDFIVGGGAADFKKNMAQLKGVLDDLVSGKSLTGPLTGNAPDWFHTTIPLLGNPDAVNSRETVEEVVQRNLRLVLGAQFTEKEGERLISRAYNPKLQEDQNAKRLGRLFTAMETAFNAKLRAAAYFEENGTMAGYKGVESVTAADIEREFDRLEGYDNVQPKQQARLQDSLPKVANAEDYKALPPGTKYLDPTGQMRTKR